jgi:hypothetical protein
MRSALSWKLQGDVRCAEVAKAVEKYLDFEAFVYWLRPLFQTSKFQLPAHVALELGQECPGLLEFASREISGPYEAKSRSWERLFNWGEDHVLSHAKKQGWLDCVLRQAAIHPRHVRLADYTALWCKSQRGKTGLPYPYLRQWRRDMEDYVRASRT